MTHKHSHKDTHANVASKASDVLRDKHASADEKSAAGSALSQRGTDKTTGAMAASEASAVLRDKHSSKKEKSAAGSSLSQREK
jgi:hypothetical protein